MKIKLTKNIDYLKLYLKKKRSRFKKLINQIKSSIINVGFNNTANIYSISESAKFGGDIGWINENNLSEIILKDLKKFQKDKIQMLLKLEIIL